MDEPQDDALRSLSRSAAYVPKEQLQAISEDEKRMYIGIPRETSFQENRVALTPDAVRVLTSNGHEVVMETKAGEGANFSDTEFSEAGARITYTVEDVYKATLILKVAPPSQEEIAMMDRGQYLVSALQLSTLNREYLEKLMEKKITAIAWDYYKDEDGIYPLVRAMGEIAGTTSILVAAELLGNHKEGRKSMLGGISGVTPTEVVIIGAGAVGEYATRAALGLGASVMVFDSSTYKLSRLQNDIGVRLKTCTIQPQVLSNALAQADVAIGAVRARSGRTPCIVTEMMVENMKAGAVIVDVSIDQGGCFETSEVTNHKSPTITKYDVIHYGVPNIASRVSKTASRALSNIFVPILLNFGEHGNFENVLRAYSGVRNGTYLYNGTLTNKVLADSFNLKSKDLDLLMAAF